MFRLAGRTQARQDGFGLFHLPHREQQRRAVNLRRIGAGPRRRGIGAESLQQVPGAISSQRRIKAALFVPFELEILEVQDRRVIETPLQDVVGDETGGTHRRFTRFGHGLLAVR